MSTIDDRIKCLTAMVEGLKKEWEKFLVEYEKEGRK